MMSEYRKSQGMWVLAFCLVAALIGWVHEFKANISLVEQVKWQEVSLLNTVVRNEAALKELIEAKRVGPRNTACDAKLLLEELRRKNIDIPHQRVEDRCLE